MFQSIQTFGEQQIHKIFPFCCILYVCQFDARVHQVLSTMKPRKLHLIKYNVWECLTKLLVLPVNLFTFDFEPNFWGCAYSYS